jgi:hypothetical protein
VVIFGGYRFSVYRTDVWELSLEGEGSWKKLEPVGTPPSERVGEIVMHDPRRHRMILVGGAVSPQQGMDTWSLAMRGRLEWSPLIEAARPPSGRYGHTAIYDSKHERMVIFGGSTRDRYAQLDAWALPLAGDPKWVPLWPRKCCGQPSAGNGHSAIHDPVRERMLLFGGITYHEHYPSEVLNELWSLSLAGEPCGRKSKRPATSRHPAWVTSRSTIRQGTAWWCSADGTGWRRTATSGLYRLPRRDGSGSSRRTLAPGLALALAVSTIPWAGG